MEEGTAATANTVVPQSTTPAADSQHAKNNAGSISNHQKDVNKDVNEHYDKEAVAAFRRRQQGPMSRAEYEQRQSQIREVYDPQSGRTRLIRGDGEVIERLVSRDMHHHINQLATRGDGTSFARSVMDKATSKSRRR